MTGQDLREGTARIAGVIVCGVLAGAVPALVHAAPQTAPSAPASAPPAAAAAPQDDADKTFRLGEIVTVVATPDVPAGVGGSEVTADDIRTFDKISLEQAVNLVPGVSSTLDANGRRNESDIFVRGFGRWQVPLMIDGVRVYLPADNRLDFSRFLTADIASIQVRKGYASVLDGPGAMGGSINLVTRTPTRPLEFEGGVSTGGRGDVPGWNGYAIAGTRQARYYAQASAAYSARDYWSLSDNYAPTATSLQAGGRRLSSDTRDWRVNVKAGFTPNQTDEYTFNHTQQAGEKGAPLNVYNNPPVPANSYWRWPSWDVQSTSLLSTTRVGAASYVKTKLYYNSLQNALDAFDDGTYAAQDTTRAFHSPYDDHAYGAVVEFGTNASDVNLLKAAVHYRTDVHQEQQTNRPTNPTLAFTEPAQEQAQNTWSVALEDTLHVTPSFDLVGGVSFDQYTVTKAQEFNAAAGLFEYPKGGSDSLNWQAAAIWRLAAAGEFHASVSDRARFPVFLELYSTRMGTATPNPSLGPERATNVEVGWTSTVAGARLSAAVFYSDVRDLIQTVVLPDATTQSQNVGNGDFRGAELSIDGRVARTFRAGGNYTFIQRTITDALLPNLKPTGVPTHKAFLYASWQPAVLLVITPSLEMASDRWSDVSTTPVPAVPYIETGAYGLLNLDVTYTVATGVEAVVGFKNLRDSNVELAWGLPQPGRTFYVKTRVLF